jgi:hypothetical protein
MSRLIFNEGVAPSAPASGKDAIFVTNEALPRLRREDSAGNVWPVAEILMLSQAADYTIADVSTAQKTFNATANGQITLPSNSGYLLEAEYMLSATGAVAHTWAVLFAGTATITAFDFAVHGRSGVTSAATLTTDQSVAQANGAGSLPTTALVCTASQSAADWAMLSIRGTLRINAGGTLIPQIKLSAATTGTNKMLRGSYIRLIPIGSDTATTLGNWT